jgi:hypothetical protein
MSQNKAISQTPIDLTPEDEAKPNNVSGMGPAEAGASERADGAPQNQGQGAAAWRGQQVRAAKAPGRRYCQAAHSGQR